MGIETVALVAGAAAALAGTGATVYQGQQQAKQVEKAADTQANEAAKQRAALAEKQAQEQATTAAKDARTRLKMNVTGNKGGTVLTSPVGLPGLQSYGGSTYLGGGRS